MGLQAQTYLCTLTPVGNAPPINGPVEIRLNTTTWTAQIRDEMTRQKSDAFVSTTVESIMPGKWLLKGTVHGISVNRIVGAPYHFHYRLDTNRRTVTLGGKYALIHHDPDFAAEGKCQ